ncbi:MAG: TraR/DksA C4-type zinc finger protein [Acidimicrobiales bacterium]
MHIDETTARRLLEEEHAGLLRSLRTVAGDIGEGEAGASDELSDVDQHPADVATEVADMERDFGLRTDFRGRVEENRAALGRLEAGRYGVCERCGREIDGERLGAVPSTRYCAKDEVAVAEGR